MSATAFNRTTLKSGPAILTWNGATMYFKKGLTIEQGFESFDVTADIFAGADKRRGQQLVTIKGEPSGQWTSLGVWFALLTAPRGTRAHGATDKAAVVKFLDGDIYTFHNAGLVGMPDLVLSATKTALTGALTLEARTKNNTDPTASASFFTRSSGSFSDTTFDWADVPTQVYTCSWGSSPWDAFHTREGIKISAKPKWSDLVVDALGVVDRELDMLEVTAQFVPVGIPIADIDAKVAMQNSANAAMGSRLAGIAEDLIISGTGVYVQMRSAVARKVPQQAGTDGKGRFGELEAVSTLGISTGAALAQLVLDTEAP